MSNKLTKRGHSHFIEKLTPYGKKFINTCAVCGQKGYSPTIEQEGFCDTHKHKVIYTELTKTLSVLPLDEFGRCETCARVQDGK